MHFAIAGNIGSGKTTLTQLLSKELDYKPHYEDIEHNPYLTDFYNDMEAWSFHLQVYFLGKRVDKIVKIKASPNNVIQDRTIFEDAYIFAENLHDMGLMRTRDFKNYLQMFNLMKSFVAAPDLLIYLRADVETLVNQIKTRGRSYESAISKDYLDKLNRKYENWISNYHEGKLLIVDVNELDFVSNKKDLSFIYDEIKAVNFDK